MKKATVISKPDSDIFAPGKFDATVEANKESAKALKNKSLVRVAKRTYANSVIRRNGTVTESAAIDICLASVQDLSGKVTVQQVIEFCSKELILINRARFMSHVRKNKYQVEHVTVKDNDVLRFKK